MMCTYLFFFIILEQSLWKQPYATHDPDSPQQQQQKDKKKEKKKRPWSIAYISGYTYLFSASCVFGHKTTCAVNIINLFPV